MSQAMSERGFRGNLETLESRLALAQLGFVVHDIDQARAAAEPPMILADLDGDGAPDMLSKNIWRRNEGAGQFGPTRLMFTGRRVEQLFAADLDRDGDIDVVATGKEGDFSGPSVFAWFENLDGRGTLSAARSIGHLEDSRYSSVTGGDMDGDGDTDLLQSIDGAVHLYENIDGRGNFRRTVTWQGYFGQSAYDLDGDHDLDIIVSDLTTRRLDWLENRGDEFVARELLSDVGTVKIEDVNRDGVLDFILTDIEQPAIVWHEYDRTSQSLTYRETIHPSIGASQLATGDIDGDGDLDLASVFADDSPSANYSIAVYPLMSDGYGDAQRQSSEWGPSNGSGLALEDLDGDDTADLMYANAIQFFDSNAAPVGGATPFARPSRQFDGVSIIADLDRDGDDDVIASDVTDYCYASYGDCTTRLQWYENVDNRGNFVSRGEIWQDQNHLDFQGIRALEAADVDGDGDVDVVFQTYSSGDTIKWIENIDGTGTFGAARSAFDGTLVTVADIDNDGLDDLVTYRDNELKLDFNVADPSAEPLGLRASIDPFRPQDHIVDWDGDDDLDIVTLLGSNFVWHENLGGRNFATPQPIIATAHDEMSGSRFFADLNGDGNDDTLWQSKDGTVVWQESLGDNAWSPRRVLAEQSYVWAVADFNEDNHRDLLMSAQGSYDPRVHLNDGTGNFTRSNVYLTQWATKLVDIDQDGDLDVFDTQQRVWYERRNAGDVNGDGIFNSSDLVSILQAGEYEDWLTENSTFETGDFNGDREFDSSDFVAVFQLGVYLA